MKNKPGIMDKMYGVSDYNLLKCCTLCPRECRLDRFREVIGYCGSGAGTNIASICIHRGEEPVISGQSGICNVFFAGCNLRCTYCQNYEISRKGSGTVPDETTFENVLDKIEKIVREGIRAVGFVSPSHMVPQVKAIIAGLKSRDIRPIIVYNTNSYDKIETIRSLNGLVDVYLPDLKYVSPGIALEYSDAADYPDVALAAIKEMYFQKGSTLIKDESGVAENGLLIRHLVLPGHPEESIKVLRTIADDISTGVSISLMSQYRPTAGVIDHTVLGRTLYKHEYDLVAEEMERLGFRNGWVQSMESSANYNPDFSKEQPFEEGG
jgi:putative pyruvate formate lyase activating enzyme